ncbi:MAG: Mur ligase family protein, partial [Bacteriovoracales bacterium]|nr:Mur ligase family protein [Bacteriovoracales bacterium]
MNLQNQLDESALFSRRDSFRRIFFYRLCGAGMAPAAILLKEWGAHVEGSDLRFDPPLGPLLKDARIPCHFNEAITVEQLRSFDLIVVGNVVAKTSDEARMIENLGVPFCSFPAIFGGLLLKERNVVGICGTHGKSTTTYFAVQLFEALGEKPGYFIGGAMEDRPPSRLGDEKYFFIEGDEYDSAYFHKVSKFRSYYLNSMILTSLEFDHGDLFSSLEEIKDQFRPSIEKLDDVLIGCQDYETVCELAREKVTTRTSSKNCNKGKVTVLHPDKIGRRQRGATEACFLHVAGKRRGSRLPR